MNLAEFVKKAESVFVLPDSVTRLKSCMEDETSGINDVAEIITFDPTLTSQLLKIANSSLYNFTSPIETVSRAVQVIGTRATYDLALSYGVSHTFKDMDSSVIDIDRFWEQSVSCALLAKHFASVKRIRESERFFVTGLLHNIGELAIAQLAPEQAKLCNNTDEITSSTYLQRQVLGFTYCDFSAALIKDWGLPASIYMPISKLLNNDIAALDEDALIAKLAYLLSEENVSLGRNIEHRPSRADLLKALNFSEEDTEDALDETNVQLISVIQLFNPNGFNIF
ncbi:HDOD domain-containing protein [Alteromonas lipolytica]|uniref:Histidine kinase n=1 Tax=Alteromonas lipolytica TaxID=1856405 RepID=A0A1E8FH75_9ALTE|nr:HDOD domain-containing protein [Alteromonas lipolytica]OFI34813.1 histidine kinase [Alteromonas lipolytica]GGF54201.1 hypothetical protein GCM10011338_02990 [Alteromonas lipolytica]